MAPKKNTVLWALYIPGLALSICRGLLVPVLPFFVQSFEASYSWVGLVLAAQGMGALLADVPAGALLRRWGRRPAMLMGAGVAIVATTALYWAQDLYQIMGLQLVGGMGTSLWNIARHAYIADLIRSQNRGRAIAVLGGIGRIGTFVGPSLGGAVAAVWGLRAPFLLFGLLGSFALAAAALWVEETASTKQVDPAAKTGVWAVFAAHWSVLATAGSGQLFAQTIRQARYVIIPLYAGDALGLEVAAVGLIVSLGSALDMMMFYPAGLVMDRWGRKFAYVPSFFMQALGMALVPFTAGFWSLLVVALLIGLGNGLGSGTMMTLGADLAPPQARGEFLGLWRFIGDGGSLGGPLLVGRTADVLGLATAPWVLAGVGVLGAVVLWGFVPETLERRK